MKTLLKILNFVILFTSFLFARTIHVPSQQTTIQNGINAAVNYDTVLVDIGTYVENIDFNGKNIVVGSLFLTTGDTSYISQTIIDGNQNGHVVIFENGEPKSAELCGFTIKNGSAGNGGGIYCNSSNPTLRYLIIMENSAGTGGGIWCNYSDPHMNNLIVINNNSDWGGGLRCDNSSPTVLNSIFGSNSGSIQGGGITCAYNSDATFKNILICNNVARDGGGMCIENNSNLNMANVTIVNNTSSWGGDGIFLYTDAHITLVNGILWGLDQQDILAESGSSVTANYSDIQGGWEGVGNIDADPFFVDTSKYDFRLSNYSPCIGVGTLIGAPDTDINGNYRPDPGGTNPDMGAYENSMGTPLQGPGIVVSNNTLNFGLLFPGYTDSLELIVENAGNENLIIMNTEISPSEYTISAGSDTISPRDTSAYTVYFSPQTIGVYPGTLTIVSNDPVADTLYVILEGECAEPPQISVTPDSLRTDLFTGQVSVHVLTIENIGGSDLNYEVSCGGSLENYALQFDGEDDHVIINNLDRNVFTFEAWIKRDRLSGVQEDRIMISVNSGGWGIGFNPDNTIMFTHVGTSDVRSTGTVSDTVNWHHIALVYNGSNVSYYIDGNFDSSPSCTYTFDSNNGYYTIGARGSWAEFYKGQIDEVRVWNTIRSESEINTYLNRELHGTENGLVGYWNFNEGSGTITYDMSKNENNGNMQGGIEWINSTAPFIGWLYADPISGIIPFGSSSEISVTFDASGLEGGDYESDVLIISNDPEQRLTSIPTHLHVTAAPDIFVSDTLLDYGVVYIDIPVTDTLVISNIGTAPLSISDISTTDSDYTTDTTGFDLSPGGVYNLLVTFTPDNSGISLATLTISCNDPDEQSIIVSLKGDVLIPPNIVVSPASLSDSLVMGETLSEIIQIKNLSGYPLNIHISCNDHQNALEFDGIDDFVNINDSPVFDIGNEGDMTLEIWMLRSNDGFNEGVISHTNGEMGKGWWFSFNAMNEPGFCMMGHSHTNSEIKILKNNWAHIVTVISGTTAEFYINGQYYWGDDMAMSIDDANADLKIGFVQSEDFGGEANYFSGIIDEVRLWNVIRSQTEIQNNMYTDLTGTEAGLIGYWNFNEGSGNIAYDSTPNGNNGILNGGVNWIPSPLKSWLSVSPDSGIIPAGDSLDVDITCDASNLLSSEYEAEIIISCNDPDTQDIIIPVFIEVTPTGIEDRNITKIPLSFKLFQNYPNPFNPSTVISWQVGATCKSPVHVELSIYNLLGQKIETLLNKSMPAGYHEVEFNGQNLSSGVYLYRIEAGEWSDVKKMVYIK